MPAPRKGRGTVWAIAHRFEGASASPFDDGWGTLDQEVTEERSPRDAGHRRAVEVDPRPQRLARHRLRPVDQPHRGCEHGCVYCFARPTHSYLNLARARPRDPIVAWVNAAERLREAFARPRLRAAPAQPRLGDRRLPAGRVVAEITRRVIEVLAEHAHPFSVVTKSSGIERDLDLIAPCRAPAGGGLRVGDDARRRPRARIMGRAAGAGAPSAHDRGDAGAGRRAGGVSVSPLIPFVNEPELERILEAAARSGATSAFCGRVLRLPWKSARCSGWLAAPSPSAPRRDGASARDARRRDYDACFGACMRGEGVMADLLAQRMDKACARLD